MYWYWIHVYNNEQPLGSFYTDKSKRIEVISEIDNKYGKDQWTRYTAE